MSTTDRPTLEDKRQETLDRLYEMREDLKTVAEADVPYSKYAKEGLRTLREEGYDV